MRNTFAATLLISMLNGIFSPFVLFVFITYWIWYPGFLPQIPQAVYFASSLILSTLTVMVSGIPAALYERYAAQPSETTAGIIWVSGAMLLTLPALPNILRVAGFG
jgi:hypothetical protein